jgi:hypothetical protein
MLAFYASGLAWNALRGPRRAVARDTRRPTPTVQLVWLNVPYLPECKGDKGTTGRVTSREVARGCLPPQTCPFPHNRHLGTFSPMKFGRRAMDDEADEIIDLRERLAPYTAEGAVLDELPLNPEHAPALAAPTTDLSPVREPSYQPRHLAP